MNETMNLKFYHRNENEVVWWVNNTETIGEHLFSFDKQRIYNLFADYPHNLTPSEKEIFDKENPHWRDFFADRNV